MTDRRPRRKRKSMAAAEVSAAHYVGYVEDNESIEAIMKKFEELEKMKQELLKPTTGSSSSSSSSSSTTQQQQQQQQQLQSAIPTSLPPTCTSPTQFPESAPEPELSLDSLTQEQLEELFKRTSSFSVKSAVMQSAMQFLEDVEDEEWREEDDYQYLNDDMLDEELGVTGGATGSKRRRDRSERPSVPRNRGVDKQSIINRYKMIQMQVQDRNGNYYMVKKKVAAVDPTLPTYVKIPAIPISRSWVKSFLSYATTMAAKTDKIPGSKYHEIDGSVFRFPLSTLGNKFQAIYMDPPFILPQQRPEDILPGQITLEQFAKGLGQHIPNLITQGFLFIWVEKEVMPQVLKITEKWGFKYVENFAWIKKTVDNRIVRQPSTYFNKSKTTCLILRLETEIELRHQRSPDCEFDFIKPRLPDELCEQKPRFMYDVIETLLPQAVYHPENNPSGARLLELWAPKGERRKGWTHIVQVNHGKEVEMDVEMETQKGKEPLDNRMEITV